MLIRKYKTNLQHTLDQLVHELLTVAPITLSGFVETVSLGVPAALGGLQLEGGQEVVGVLEVGANSVDLVDEIFHARDAELAEGVMDLAVVIQGDALLVDATEATLQQQTADVVDVSVTVGDVGLNDTEHVQGTLVDLDEDTVVHLSQTQQFQDLSGLGGELVGTGNADNKDELGFRLNEEVSLLMSLTTSVDQVALLTVVLLVVLGLVGAGKLAETLVLSLELLASLVLLGEKLGIAGSFLLLTFGQDLRLDVELGVDLKTISHNGIYRRRRRLNGKMVS